MESQNLYANKNTVSLGHRRQASLGLGIITNLETNDSGANTNNTTESSKNASFFRTSNPTITAPPPRLSPLVEKNKDATHTPLESTIIHASRLRNTMNKDDPSLTPIPDKETKNTNMQDNKVKVRRARSYRFKPPYYDNDDEADDGIMPLPSPVPTSATPTSTNLIYRLSHELHKHPGQCHQHVLSSTQLESDDSNKQTNSITSPVTPPSTSIPIIAISPTFVHKNDVIPQLSDHPMLGDMDDTLPSQQGQLFQHQKPSRNNDRQRRPGVMIRESSSSSGLPTTSDHSIKEENLIGKQLGDYYIRRLLGMGAFSKVYLAEHPLKKLFAIKTINKSSMIKNSRFRSSIEREVAILKLIDHPHIVHIEATMETEHSLCIILEYAKGIELFEFVQKTHQREERVYERLIKQIFLQLVDVVKWMHQHNIVHRDLKLENIMIHMDHGDPILKVTDFGLARVIDPDSPILTTRCGSEEYAAPEIVQSKGYDGRQTDTWTLGIILYALLVGYLPFRYDATKGERVTQMFYRIVRAQVKWPNTGDHHLAISSQVKNVVERILVRQPEQRIHLDDIDCLPWFQQ